MKKVLFGVLFFIAFVAYGQDENKTSFQNTDAFGIRASFNTIQGDWGDFYDFSYSAGLSYRFDHSEDFDWGLNADFMRIMDNEPFEGENFFTIGVSAFLDAPILNNVGGEVFGSVGYGIALADGADYGGLVLDVGYNFQLCESFSVGPRTSIWLDDPNLCLLGVLATFYIE